MCATFVQSTFYSRFIRVEIILIWVENEQL